MIPSEVVITAIFTGIVAVLGVTFKHIKSSHCWSKNNCCDCATRGDRNSNSNIQPIIIQQPATVVTSSNV
jgi:uncharacterized protein (DUF1499 family)